MSKEHAYAYEAGYRDGSIHYELEHCPACKNVADLQEALALNDELLAFNDKLLAENEHMRLKDMAVIGELLEENERLKSDNAKLREQVDAAHMSRLLTENENEKLRELVRDLWLQLLNAYDRKELDGFTDRMRELGVEVDG